MLYLLHPAVVHFSVAFVVAGGLAEALGILRGKAAVERFGAALVLVGTLTVLLTVVTGFLAANTVPMKPGVEDDLAQHERLGVAALALMIISQVWKAWHQGTLPRTQRTVYALFLFVCVAVLVLAAYHGGQLVYRHGLGVGE